LRARRRTGDDGRPCPRDERATTTNLLRRNASRHGTGRLETARTGSRLDASTRSAGAATVPRSRCARDRRRHV